MLTPLLAAVLLAATGAATGTDSGAAPGKAPGAGSAAGDPAPAGPVLTLNEAQAQAEGRNLDLVAGRARLEQARTLSKQAWSHYLPQVTLGASLTRYPEDAIMASPTAFAIRNVGRSTSAPSTYDPTKPFSAANLPGVPTTYAFVPYGGEELEFQKQWTAGAQVEVKQALLVPRLWPAIRNAGTAARAAERTVEAARREVVFGATQLYFAAAGLQEAARVQRRILEVTRQHERDAEAHLAAGLTVKLGLLRAQTDRARAEQDLLRADSAYQAAKLALATLLDRDPDFEVERPAEPESPGDALALEGTAAEERPDVEAARERLQLSLGQRDEVRMRYAPDLGLSALYRVANITGYIGRNDEWAVTLGLTWTLWDGGLREAQLAEAEQRVAEWEATSRGAARRARDEVRRAALDLSSATASRSKAEEQARLAREAVIVAEQTFKAGFATQLDVSDATSTLSQAELQLVAATLEAELAQLRLARAAGRFDPRR